MDVLLVEDEAMIRQMLVEDLTDAGLDVCEACNAESALRAVGEADAPPCVIVTDVELGSGMNGLAFVAEARRRWPGVGVVVMTGRPSNLSERKSDAREVCLLKPFGPPRLAAAIQSLMRRSGR
jgi:DNA-binding response OmpR family regulator